jgi:two-component system capsular synthesis response regulator RcsB
VTWYGANASLSNEPKHSILSIAHLPVSKGYTNDRESCGKVLLVCFTARSTSMTGKNDSLNPSIARTEPALSTSPLQPLRIILADDHPIFRIGLQAVLDQISGVKVVAQAGSPKELLTHLHAQQCDVLVTDFMMPAEEQNDGLKLLEQIRRHYPHLPILVVTMLSNAGLFRAMLNLGVNGLLSKASLADELPQAIGYMAQGKTYLATSVQRLLLQEGAVREDMMGVQENLSPKELEVTRLLAAGHTVSQIAALLNRSKQTVSTQKVSAMRKLGVANDAALYLYLQEHGLR